MTTSLLPVRSGTNRSRSGGDPAGPKRRRPSGALISWLFLIPAILLAVWFKFIPMIEGVRLSLFKVQPFLGNEWVGLDNYTDVLTDARFREALGHTLILGIGQTVGALIVGALLALLLEGQTRSLWVLRSAVFLPVVTATAVSGEIWRLIYHPTPDGPLNSLLSLLGLGPSQFIAGTDTALWSVMAVGVWIGAPYNMVIVLAGLAGVDRALYESASVDGAGTLRRLWHITVPALRPAIAVILTLAAIRSLRTFTEVYVLTGGGPAGSTEVWMTRVISLGLEENNIGRASAASVLLLLLTLTATLAVRFATRKKEA
ncbi:sugar ABC transporter permease [Actinoplanes missouriensis]|uniref:carbohydrate ABC transporter permease n=1 Tax=Actinoplanes missouriensis TaxID=1866 RepID=UPI0034092769